MRLIAMCVMTKFPVGSLVYLLHNKAASAVTCVTWLTTMFDRTRCYMRHNSVSSDHVHVLHSKVVSAVTCVTHPDVWHDTFIRDVTPSNVTWLAHMCDITYLYVKRLLQMWHDSSKCVTYLFHTWRDSFICDMFHSHIRYDVFQMWNASESCHMPHSYVHMWHDSFPCSYVTWLTPICNMMYSKCKRVVWANHPNMRESSKRVIGIAHICRLLCTSDVRILGMSDVSAERSLESLTDFKCERVMSHLAISHVAHTHTHTHTRARTRAHTQDMMCFGCERWASHVTHVIEWCHTHEWFMSHIWLSHVTHMNESGHTY